MDTTRYGNAKLCVIDLFEWTDFLSGLSTPSQQRQKVAIAYQLFSFEKKKRILKLLTVVTRRSVQANWAVFY